MAIKGEVHIQSMVWAPKISLNDGKYVIRPFECKIVGKAEGLARVRASIHTFFATFDDEEWRIITLFVNHLDSKTKYIDLFAASCGSIGDFTDIKLGDEGYAMTRQMKHFNVPVRNFDGTFYAQVHPFDPSYFAVKVHPSRRCSEAVSSLASGPRADSLPWFDSPLVQGASRPRYTDKAQMQRPGHTGRKALATKKNLLSRCTPLVPSFSRLTTPSSPCCSISSSNLLF